MQFADSVCNLQTGVFNRKKKKRQRPRERRQSQAKSDSSSSSSDDDADASQPAAKPTPASGGGSKSPVSAFPQLKPVGAAVRDKAIAEMRIKFRKHCTSFLIGKCTRDTCKFTHAVPSGFKAMARTVGYKELGAAAKGVKFE